MTNRYYHGARTELTVCDLIAPPAPSGADARDPASTHVLLTPNLDEAIWSAELAAGDAPARVYVVEPLGPIARVSQQPDYQPPGHPSMSWCSRTPLRVTGEVTEWLYYHGTRADLQPGDLIRPGHVSNFGATARTANYIYFTRTLDAAAWGRAGRHARRGLVTVDALVALIAWHDDNHLDQVARALDGKA